MDRRLSINESKLVAEFLRTKHRAPISSSVEFWKLTPTETADRAREKYGIKVNATDISKAARREEVQA